MLRFTVDDICIVSTTWRTWCFFTSLKCFVIILQETVGDSLVELWISYNQIEKLKGINVLKKLKVCHAQFCTTLA